MPDLHPQGAGAGAQRGSADRRGTPAQRDSAGGAVRDGAAPRELERGGALHAYRGRHRRHPARRLRQHVPGGGGAAQWVCAGGDSLCGIPGAAGGDAALPAHGRPRGPGNRRSGALQPVHRVWVSVCVWRGLCGRHSAGRLPPPALRGARLRRPCAAGGRTVRTGVHAARGEQGVRGVWRAECRGPPFNTTRSGGARAGHGGHGALGVRRIRRRRGTQGNAAVGGGSRGGGRAQVPLLRGREGGTAPKGGIASVVEGADGGGAVDVAGEVHWHSPMGGKLEGLGGERAISVAVRGARQINAGAGTGVRLPTVKRRGLLQQNCQVQEEGSKVNKFVFDRLQVMARDMYTV
mmetsp:Transcript_36942/g.80483  ORF Transcript_36942/g.80483 Transcript_36942/m.80483 type:complete len:349 (+) Transcript_36942:769-1815(+)